MYYLYILCLIPVIYEDFKYRAIHWIWIALLIILALLFHPVENKVILNNLIFIFVQLGLLSIYFSIKHRKLINITKDYLGIGDILFFIPLCLLFSNEGLILFFISSLTISLLFFLFWMLITKKENQTIPLAGSMSLILIIILLISSIFNYPIHQINYMG